MSEWKIDSGLIFRKEKGEQWKQVDFYPSPHGGNQIRPKYFVIHFTAGRQDAHGTAQWFQNPNAKASAHWNLGEDGTVTQCMSLEKKAWHAGKSRWGGISNLNNHSIGVEVCNPGPLEKTNKGWKAWFGKIYTDPDIIEAPHPNNPSGPVYGWIPFTEEQIDVLIGLGKVIMEEYDIIEAVGHDMIAPGRKTDPGPCMSNNVYRILNESNRDDREHEASKDWEWYVGDVSSLNGRGGPGTSYPILASLEGGTEIEEVMDRRGVWWEVETANGLVVWVHSKFLKTRKFDAKLKKD